MTHAGSLRIAVVEPDRYSAVARATLEVLGTVTDGPFDRTGLIAAAATSDVLVVRLAHTLDAELLGSPNLRVVVSPTTGLDHIDLEAAQRHGVAVLSLQGETKFLRTVRATVEHTLALMLAVVRRVPAAALHVESGGWDRDPYRGRELAGKRLGIVGLGRIGESVAALGKAFGMEVVAYDPYKDDWGPEPKKAASLSELLQQSDVVSMHVPLNDETRGMVGAAQLAELPRGAVVINTARGAVFDESALVAALVAGQVGGVGLDVLADEPAIRAGEVSPVVEFARKNDNVVITPHIGGATKESMERTEEFMAEKLRAWITSELPTGPRDSA